MRERVDIDLLGRLVNVAKTSKGVGTIDVHGTRTADTLSAGTTESKGWILLVLDL